MFPALRERFLDRLDLLVELGTLGEYGIAEDGRPLALEPECERPEQGSRARGECLMPPTPRPRRGPSRPRA